MSFKNFFKRKKVVTTELLLNVFGQSTNSPVPTGLYKNSKDQTYFCVTFPVVAQGIKVLWISGLFKVEDSECSSPIFVPYSMIQAMIDTQKLVLINKDQI